MEVVSAETAKEIDKITINEIGIPSIVLMENAAQAIVKEILGLGDSYCIFCGVGNNGGDGLAIARKLILKGKRVTVFINGNEEQGSDEFKINLNILRNLKALIYSIKDTLHEDKIIGAIKESEVVIDALFGVGINRDIAGNSYKLITLINDNSRFIVSVDVPSGLDCNTGECKGIAIRANLTFNIEVIKTGLITYNASNYLGEVKTVYIGIPEEVKSKCSEGIYMASKDYYKSIMPRRSIYGHKGDYGKVLILAGSLGFSGAAFITTEATVRGGAGLVTLLIEEDIRQALSSRLIEAMTLSYKEEKKISNLIRSVNVIACGPGIGRKIENENVLKRCILESRCPLVVDADALNYVSDHKELLKHLKGRAIFTPHPGEMAKLTGKTIDEVEKNRIHICREYAKDNEIIVVLKGYNTVISDGKKVYINKTGSSKMASAGMGDCLTGIITSLIAQGLKNFEGAILGCYIHGLAGDRLAADRFSVNARDIIEEIPKTMEELK